VKLPQLVPERGDPPRPACGIAQLLGEFSVGRFLLARLLREYRFAKFDDAIEPLPTRDRDGLLAYLCDRPSG
jgi:hypothetical protein